MGKKNFALSKELDGKPLVAPPWSHCLSYELELRREAYKRCRERSMGFSSAWWETYGDSEHRMLHWLQLVSLANSAPPTSELSIESLVQKEVSAQLRSADRSRTPLGRGGKGSPQQLALPCLAASSSAADMNLESKGKGKRKNKRNRAGKRPPAGTVWQLRDLLRGGPEVQSMLQASQGNGICFAFQEGRWEHGPSCSRQHVCIGCGGTRGYNECQCLQSRLAALL